MLMVLFCITLPISSHRNACSRPPFCLNHSLGPFEVQGQGHFSPKEEEEMEEEEEEETEEEEEEGRKSSSSALPQNGHANPTSI